MINFDQEIEMVKTLFSKIEHVSTLTSQKKKSEHFNFIGWIRPNFTFWSLSLARTTLAYVWLIFWIINLYKVIRAREWYIPCFSFALCNKLLRTCHLNLINCALKEFNNVTSQERNKVCITSRFVDIFIDVMHYDICSKQQAHGLSLCLVHLCVSKVGLLSAVTWRNKLI